jgi:hypothetical protein
MKNTCDSVCRIDYYGFHGKHDYIKDSFLSQGANARHVIAVIEVIVMINFFQNLLRMGENVIFIFSSFFGLA